MPYAIIHDEIVPTISAAIWHNALNVGAIYEDDDFTKRKLTHTAYNELYNIRLGYIGDFNKIFNTARDREAHLRISISKELANLSDNADDNYQRFRIFNWIIEKWGNIVPANRYRPQVNTRIYAWARQFTNYSNIMDFIITENMECIASWSKVLAFINYKLYPIYDARVAISLNIILSQLELPYRFYLPAGANTLVAPAEIILNNDISQIKKQLYITPFFGYRAYIQILNSIVNQGLAVDILEAEMLFFLIASDLAVRFWIKKRDQEIVQNLNIETRIDIDSRRDLLKSIEELINANRYVNDIFIPVSDRRDRFLKWRSDMSPSIVNGFP